MPNIMSHMTDCVEKLIIELNSFKQKIEKTKINEFKKYIKNLKNIKYTMYPNYDLILIYEDFMYKSPIVFSTQTLLPICSFYNTPIIDNNAIDMLSEVQWNCVTVHKMHLDSLHICLFWHIDNWYIAFKNTIVKINEENNIANIFKNVLTNQLQCEKWIDLLNKTLIYHFALKHSDFDHIGILNTVGDNNYITLLYICDQSLLLCDCDNNDIGIIKNMPLEKKYYFSCLDEFQTSLEITNDSDVTHKSLTCCGYSILVLSDDKLKYINYLVRTNIYKHIVSVLPTRPNKYINYLELYQKNILGDILPYIHKYPLCVIKRINISIKTISKEILNIYHLTRQKQNTTLYECLSQHYKKTLYDLHKIYVNQKYGDFIVKSNEMLKEKKSISVDVVYNYIKGLLVDDLIQLFIDRKTLMQNLDSQNYDYSKILIINNIDIIAQMELMGLS